MPWQLRHAGSPRSVSGLSAQDIADGLRDGTTGPTDEVIAPGETEWRTIEDHPHFADVVADLDTLPKTQQPDESNVDMNAIIDVTFVLLIFFILTAAYATMVQKVIPLSTQEEKKNKRQTRTVKREEMRKHMIHMIARLDGKGKPVIRVENQTVQVLKEGGQKADQVKMKEILRPYVLGGNRKTEILFESKGIHWGLVVSLQEAAKTAGIRVFHHVVPKKQ